METESPSNKEARESKQGEVEQDKNEEKSPKDPSSALFLQKILTQKIIENLAIPKEEHPAIMKNQTFIGSMFYTQYSRLFDMQEITRDDLEPISEGAKIEGFLKKANEVLSQPKEELSKGSLSSLIFTAIGPDLKRAIFYITLQ